jgi:hypothetical protein
MRDLSTRGHTDEGQTKAEAAVVYGTWYPGTLRLRILFKFDAKIENVNQNELLCDYIYSKVTFITLAGEE